MKEIVIKIPDEKWTYAREHNYIDMGGDELANAIINGTPLPKGHGRLIDESQIHKCGWDYINHHAKTDASTIIEADKEYEVEVVTRGKCMICGKELTEGLFFCKECEAKGK